MLGPYTNWGNPGDCRQPQRNRRAFFKGIKDLCQKGFSQDLDLYNSYVDKYC